MKPGKLLLIAALGSILSACGSTQAAVTVQREVEDPESESTVTRALADVEVQLLPYDRDAIFDSLTAAADEPEPPIPDSVMAAQEAVQAAQEEWRAAEARWAALRDQLQTISNELDQLNRAERRYRELFREFQDREDQLARVERARDEAFERFTTLQNQSLAAADQIRIQREEWADEAFAEVGQIMLAHLEETGRDVHVDTTSAQGVANFQGMAPGQWWVHARFELPYEELYWNVPVTLERGTPMEIILDEGNAERRPKL